jgi:hypothetical protein
MSEIFVPYAPLSPLNASYFTSVYARLLAFTDTYLPALAWRTKANRLVGRRLKRRTSALT